MTDTESYFGNWDTTEERLEELNGRLAAWWIAGEQLPEIFAEAMRRLVAAYEKAGEDPASTPPDSLLKAFEDALGSFDNILRHFPEEHS